MKNSPITLTFLSLTLMCGCISTTHLSEVDDLMREPNPEKRLKYVAQLQHAIEDYVDRNTPDASKYDYLRPHMAGVTWVVFSDSEWVCILTHSHHADHMWPERKRVRDISIALDSRGDYYYSLFSTCSDAPIVHSYTVTSTGSDAPLVHSSRRINCLDEFWDMNCRKTEWDNWTPLPAPHSRRKSNKAKEASGD